MNHLGKTVSSVNTSKGSTQSKIVDTLKPSDVLAANSKKKMAAKSVTQYA